MYAVHPNSRRLPDGSEVFTYEREVVGLENVLIVEAGTTGFIEDEDVEGKAKTVIRICDAENSNLVLHGLKSEDGHRGVELVLTGNSELETMIRALKFITKVLEDEVQEVID